MGLMDAPVPSQLRSILRQLWRFGWANGIEVTPEALLDQDVVEAFCVRGCAHLDVRTRATYRSACYRAALALTSAPGRVRPSPLGAVATAAPYSPAERAELVSIAGAQRREATRASALVMICAGIGAGLTAWELVALRGVHVRRRHEDVVIGVLGRRPRIVVVAGPTYAEGLWGLAGAGGEEVLFRPGLVKRSYKNAVNDVARRLVCDPNAPRFSIHRARASFICDHLGHRTPLAELLAVSGLDDVGSLARYSSHLAGGPISKAALRARLATEQTGEARR